MVEGRLNHEGHEGGEGHESRCDMMIMKSGRCSEDAYRRLRYDQIVEPSPEDWIVEGDSI